VGFPASAPPQAVPYTLVTTIAQGGMGYVELCFRREGRFLRWCARKRLHESFRNDATFRSMFMDEARLAGLVRHPNAVGVLDVGEDQDGPFLIMDFVEGVSLSRVIAEAASARRPYPMQVAVRIGLDAAMGLHAAHEVRSEDGTVLRLVHRDVSPQNILIGFDGTVRVTDFGIAKALGNTSRTSAGVLKGNMGYLSPEQLRFEEPDRRSDFFSLGVTLYELLSGERLYTNKDGFDGTRRILVEPPPDIGDVRSDVPPELVELLFELLAKDRESRPATAADIAGRLEGILAALIAEEGSLTVADYMDQHFAGQRQERREFLVEQMKRLDSESPVTLRSMPAISSLPEAAPPVKLRSAIHPGWKLLLAGTVMAAAGAVAAFGLPTVVKDSARAVGAVMGFGHPSPAPISRSRGAGSASAGPPPTAPSSTPLPAPVVAAPTAVPVGAPEAPVARLALEAKKKSIAKSTRRKLTRRMAIRRAAITPVHMEPKEPTESNDRGHIAVPLFTHWQ
jgi:serine/threonine protein kinase